jgi:hypothetical protein
MGKLEDHINKLAQQIIQNGSEYIVPPKTAYRILQSRKFANAIQDFSDWNMNISNCQSDLLPVKLKPPVWTASEAYNTALEELLFLQKTKPASLTSKERLVAYNLLQDMVNTIHNKT